LSYGVVGAVWLASGELDSRFEQGRSISRPEPLRALSGSVQVADLDGDATLRCVAEIEERTRGLGW
jgi:hypothetical protein